ncbi:hypothetical protein BX600DRAFT_430386 [Xylariales sp. PMI_506]|nr:hypothetical protein BX600DRAFT_430386 [Xylariales sp. PMI_506]
MHAEIQRSSCSVIKSQTWKKIMISSPSASSSVLRFPNGWSGILEDAFPTLTMRPYRRPIHCHCKLIAEDLATGTSITMCSAGRELSHGVQFRRATRGAWGTHHEEGPVERLQKMHIFLRDQDQDRHPGFFWTLTEIKKYLEYVDQLRKNGHKSFGFHLQSVLHDCKALVRIHENFSEWTYGQTPSPTQLLGSLIMPNRLDECSRLPQLTPRSGSKSILPPLIPREYTVDASPFINVTDFGKSLDWDEYFAGNSLPLRYFTALGIHENHVWETRPLFPSISTEWSQIPFLQGPKNPHAVNYAEIENETYEKYVSFPELSRLVQLPKIHEQDAAAEFGEIAATRGFRRAALQVVLNLFSSQENKIINTPWRRVVFPITPKMSKEPCFAPRALARKTHQGDRCSREEPSPWIFWYNQYARRVNNAAASHRQYIHQKQWENSQHISLPNNINGPYIFNGMCIHDDYWFKMGHNLLVLQQNLERTSHTHSRWILRMITDDIKSGESGKGVPCDIMPRIGIDTVTGCPNSFQLVDEKDLAWLEYLCKSNAVRGPIPSNREDLRVKNHLLILFDHRIQLLLNDTLNNPFWTSDTPGSTTQTKWNRQAIPLKTVLHMINRGGRQLVRGETGDFWVAADLPDPINQPSNKLYQFNLEEATEYCSQLAKLDRLDCYLRFHLPCPLGSAETPESQTERLEGSLFQYQSKTWEAKDALVSIKAPNVFPEERIRWRHESQVALSKFNKKLKAEYTANTGVCSQNYGERANGELAKFREEINWKQGPMFNRESLEHQRGTPSWTDLLDITNIPQTHRGPCTRTINFLRVLAFRMGRTIRHFRDLNIQFHTCSKLSRGDLDEVLDEWKASIHEPAPDDSSEDNCSPIPLKVPPPQIVIVKADSYNANSGSNDLSAVFKEIRLGIIEDVVQNRSMLYPSRLRINTDKDQLVKQTFERQNIWIWAKEPIRAYHAAYRRGRYFDMKRWPLERQNDVTQGKIRGRLDENSRMQPISAQYKYGLAVGPDEDRLESIAKISRCIRTLTPAKQHTAWKLALELARKITDTVEILSEGYKPTLRAEFEPLERDKEVTRRGISKISLEAYKGGSTATNQSRDTGIRTPESKHGLSSADHYCQIEAEKTHEYGLRYPALQPDNVDKGALRSPPSVSQEAHYTSWTKQLPFDICRLRSMGRRPNPMNPPLKRRASAISDVSDEKPKKYQALTHHTSRQPSRACGSNHPPQPDDEVDMTTADYSANDNCSTQEHSEAENRSSQATAEHSSKKP